MLIFTPRVMIQVTVTVSRVYHLNNKLVETEMTTMEWHRICYI